MFVFVRFWLVKFKLLLLQRKAATASKKSSTCFRRKLLLLLEKAVPALKTSSSSVSRVSYCLIYETMAYEVEIQWYIRGCVSCLSHFLTPLRLLI